MYDPRSRIIWSISYSPICIVNLISLPFLVACFAIFQTMRGSPSVVPAHLFMSFYSPFTTLLSHNNFMHVSKNVLSIDGSIFGSGLSLLPEVEASTNLFLASMKFSLVHSKSNSGSFVRALQTQVLSSSYLPLSSLVVIPLQSTMFTLVSSSRGSDLIICRF